MPGDHVGGGYYRRLSGTNHDYRLGEEAGEGTPDVCLGPFAARTGTGQLKPPEIPILTVKLPGSTLKSYQCCRGNSIGAVGWVAKSAGLREKAQFQVENR